LTTMSGKTPNIKLVMLADDDVDHGLLFTRILKSTDPDAEIVVARDGQELFELLEKNRPDILFLDLNMPCKNGFECLQEIRNSEKFKNLPVVVYSSSAHMNDIQKSYLHQADLYMVKPFNAAHLKTALESVLKMDWRQASSFKKLYFINNRFVPFTA
jgi:CheY-like chemotaxis protein